MTWTSLEKCSTRQSHPSPRLRKTWMRAHRSDNFWFILALLLVVHSTITYPHSSPKGSSTWRENQFAAGLVINLSNRSQKHPLAFGNEQLSPLSPISKYIPWTWSSRYLGAHACLVLNDTIAASLLAGNDSDLLPIWFFMHKVLRCSRTGISCVNSTM